MEATLIKFTKIASLIKEGELKLIKSDALKKVIETLDYAFFKEGPYIFEVCDGEERRKNEVSREDFLAFFMDQALIALQDLMDPEED